MSLDPYWVNYERCLDRVQAEAKTVDDLIRIVNEHFDPSSADAFFPGGGDRDMLGTLSEADWNIIWSQADYYFAARPPGGGDGITYVEGDIYRGIQRPMGSA
jgi:hypothetical protein